MKAVILTAGEGTRMRPLTLTRPKTMLPVAGKPIIQYNIEALRDAGISEILMIVGYQENMVRDYFKDGKDLGVKISYITQQSRLGTAHAIGYAREFIKEQFIVLNGDIIIEPLLLYDLIRKYSNFNAKSMMVLTEVEDPCSFGVVMLDGDNVTEIIEKPEAGEAPSNLINTGIYIFDPDIFSCIEKTHESSRGEYEITDSLKIQMEEGKKVAGVVSNKKWIDIGKPWELLKINEDFLNNMEGKIEGNVEKGATLEGEVVLGKGSTIRAGSYIQGPVHIGENCDVGPNCYLRKYTFLGKDVRVGNAVEIKNSIIMDHTNVNHLSYIGDSIIGSRCNIAAGTNIANLRFDDKNIKLNIKGEKVDSGRRKFGVVFADGVKTGINSSFNPGVTVGCNSAIGAGAIIHQDIDSEKLVMVKQEHLIIDKNKK